MKNVKLQGEGGFTLLELIVVIVVVAVLAAMLYSYFGTAITSSATPITRLSTALSAQKVMENITDDYMVNYTSNLAGLKSKIGNEGTSNNTPSYGVYTVVDNHFVNWSATYGEITPATGNNCLKVTIKNSLGETVTQIYTTGSQNVSCQ